MISCPPNQQAKRYDRQTSLINNQKPLSPSKEDGSSSSSNQSARIEDSSSHHGQRENRESTEQSNNLNQGAQTEGRHQQQTDQTIWNQEDLRSIANINSIPPGKYLKQQQFPWARKNQVHDAAEQNNMKTKKHRASRCLPRQEKTIAKRISRLKHSPAQQIPISQ